MCGELLISPESAIRHTQAKGYVDGYQIKTRRPELGAWTLNDREMIKAIGRFVDLVTSFGDRINALYFVSNTDFDSVTPENRNDKRRSRCPGLFLEHLRDRKSCADIAEPFSRSFTNLQAECGCDADQLLNTLKRVFLVRGPSRGEFDAVLSHEHLARLPECQRLSATELDVYRDELVAKVHRASSLHVTDPRRHLWPVIGGDDPDPALLGKRLAVEVFAIPDSRERQTPQFSFHGEPNLSLGGSRSPSVLEQKLDRGGLIDQLPGIRRLELEAERNLLEDVQRRPEEYPQLQTQVEQMVLQACGEAHLRARLGDSSYGPKMLIDVQDRLRTLANEHPGMVGYHPYECLLGVAALLTSECLVWWSERFPVEREST